MVTGYLHPEYASSLAEFGTTRELPRSRGWILERQIPGFPYKDAMGCYPLFTCQDWSQLQADLEDIGDEIVSLSVVTDPFGEYSVDYLHRCFPDKVAPFKDHFVIDLSLPADTFVRGHHRRYARQALQALRVEKFADPLQFTDEWVNLYSVLIKRHGITGIRAFSEEAFARQLNIPGAVAFRAVSEERTVSMLLWYVQGETGYYHLGASSDLGYRLRASFALFWSAIAYFTDKGLRWLNLGAGAGIEGNDTDGLSRFKRGWSTGTRQSYFCGRIFDHATYTEIVKVKGIATIDYFPAYRKGEFG